MFMNGLTEHHRPLHISTNPSRATCLERRSNSAYYLRQLSLFELMIGYVYWQCVLCFFLANGLQVSF